VAHFVWAAGQLSLGTLGCSIGVTAVHVIGSPFFMEGKRMSGRQGTRDRQKLIDCGKLIDVSYEAFDAGVLHPTAITAEAWDRYIKDPDHNGLVESQLEVDRLEVIVSMLRYHLAARGFLSDLLVFYVPRDRDPISFGVVCGPADGGRPVITLELPREA
jgi:hypothetical protein